MGLDMYLTADRYLWDFGDNVDNDTSKAIGNLFPEIRSYRVKAITADIMYWRKANAIHDWFVKNVQDGVDECQKSYVSKENLRSLLETCKAVLANPDQAETLLPSRNGFFFGGTEYDEWYFDGIKHTVEVLENVVPRMETDFRLWMFHYQSSW
jgi:hypothetical protein